VVRASLSKAPLVPPQCVRIVNRRKRVGRDHDDRRELLEYTQLVRPTPTRFKRYLVLPFAFACLGAAFIASIAVIRRMTGYEGKYQTSGTPVPFSQAWTNVPLMSLVIFVVTLSCWSCGPESGRRDSAALPICPRDLGKLVRPARLERATSWFVARRSIQLS
jgi:hypothetical protein